MVFSLHRRPPPRFGKRPYFFPICFLETFPNCLKFCLILSLQIILLCLKYLYDCSVLTNTTSPNFPAACIHSAFAFKMKSNPGKGAIALLESHMLSGLRLASPDRKKRILQSWTISTLGEGFIYTSHYLIG